jgi:alpha-beta hydrolase superfamily lysophospholipase
VDQDLAAPRFDAAKIAVPTLVIRGDADANATREDNQQLMDALGTQEKAYVEIPSGGHFLHFENVNLQFYEALQTFLEAEK